MARNLGLEATPSRSLGFALRGFSALAGSNIASQLIGFAALAYVARKIGPGNLGAYGFAVAITGYFGLLSGFGMNNLATRDLAGRKAHPRAIVSETLLLQGTFSLILYVLLIALAPVLVTDWGTRRLIPIVGLMLLTGAFTLDWLLLVLGRFRAVALCRLGGQVIYALLVPLLVVSGSSGALRYAWLNVFGMAITGGCVAIIVLRTANVRPALVGREALLLRLRRSVPFGYSLVMIQIYSLVDSVMLGYLDSTHAVGIYAVANKLPMALVVLANVWINAFLPHTARRMDEPRALACDLGRVVTATIVVSGAIGVGAVLCAGRVITLMFGGAFHAAAGPFALLAIAGSLVLVQANFSNVLRGQRYYTVTITIAAATIVALNFVLIPAAGPMGSAIATLIGEVGLTTATFIGARRMLGQIPIDFVRLLRGVGAIAFMTGAIALTNSFDNEVVVQIVVGMIAFLIAARSLRVFDRQLWHGG